MHTKSFNIDKASLSTLNNCKNMGFLHEKEEARGNATTAASFFS
jgi:hypothetical protein